MSVVTVVLNLKDEATRKLLAASHAAKDLAGQSKAVAALQEELRRVGLEAERVRVGPEQFQINQALADLDRLEAQLRATGSASQEALAGLSQRRAQLVSKSADLAASSVGKLGKRAKNLSDVAGDADSALVGFSSVLDLVNPKLGSTVRVAADVGASLEGMIRIAMVGAPIIVALAAAAAAGGLAYTTWQKRVQAHKDEVSRNNEILKASQDLILDLKSATLDYLVVVGDMTRAEREIKRLRQETFISSLPRLQSITKAITEQGEAIRKAEEAFKKARDSAKKAEERGLLTPGETAVLVKAAQDLNAANAKGKKLDQERLDLIDKAKEALKVRIDTVNAEERLSSALSDTKKRADGLSQSIEEQSRLLEARANSLRGLLPQMPMSEIDRLSAANEQLELMVSQFSRVSDQLEEIDRARFEDSIDEFRQALDKAIQDFVGDPVVVDIEPRISTEEWIRQYKASGIAEKLGAITGAISSPGGAVAGATQAMGSSSNLGLKKAAGLIGPALGLASSVAGLLQKIGERDDKGRLVVEQRGKQFVAGIRSGLEALPEILGRVVPQFIASLITELIPALVSSLISLIFDLPEIMVKSLRSIFTESIPRMIRKLRDMLRNLWESLTGKDRRQAFSQAVRDPGSVTGYSVRSGFETEQREAARTAQRSRGSVTHLPDPIGRIVRRIPTRSEAQLIQGSNAPSTVINISGSLVDRSVVDRLGKELNRQFGSYGRASQPIFQG